MIHFVVATAALLACVPLILIIGALILSVVRRELGQPVGQTERRGGRCRCGPP